MGERLRGKKALVYGGGTGIGLACAEAMIREGAAVFISSRRDAVLSAAAAMLGKHGKAGYEAGDATSVADVERVTAAAVRFLGGLDTLVMSAGAGGRTPIFDTDPAEFQRIVDHNLRAAFLVMRYAARHLLAAGAASITVISSTYGLVGQRERAAYCAAKAGVIGLVRSAALDFADRGVRVNAMCPGFVETPLALEVAAHEADPEAALKARRSMHAIPRAGRLEEMGELAVYLASDLAAFVTGESIAIDGGYSAR
ncbi:MAG: SDR family oxidoreductase [Pseudomonadota bacterium]|nr:SDR family oxidoreductase [Pseudomonadota bacterium]